MKLSVIIVSYQVRHYLAQCLDSLQRALKDLESEVIVVDNHSSDDTVAYIRKNYSWVRVIASNHNLGFAKANNTWHIFLAGAAHFFLVAANHKRQKPCGRPFSR